MLFMSWQNLDFQFSNEVFSTMKCCTLQALNYQLLSFDVVPYSTNHSQYFLSPPLSLSLCSLPWVKQSSGETLPAVIYAEMQ